MPGIFLEQETALNFPQLSRLKIGDGFKQLFGVGYSGDIAPPIPVILTPHWKWFKERDGLAKDRMYKRERL